MLRSSIFLLLLAGRADAQVPICVIQGSSNASAYEGQVVTTTGTVTAVYLGSGTLGGYFLEDPTCDSNPATSNGIFVFHPTAGSIAVGQRVQVTGEVDEFQGLTELRDVSNLQVLGLGTVAPSVLQLPVASLTDWERYEGMLLQFPQTLVVTDNSDWAQYGEVALAPERLMHPTNAIDPNDAVADGTTTTGFGNVTAVTTAATTNARSVVRLDDGRTDNFPEPLPLTGPEGTIRVGSTITGLTAVLTYTFNNYRLHAVDAVPVVHALRPAVPEVGGDIRVAGFNVLNYWTTLGEWGAQDTGELQRQRTKLLATLQGLNADAFALCELENNDAAWTDLLNALNSAAGSGSYACLEVDASGGGTKTVIFYRTAVLTPVTQLYSLYTSTFQRPHLTQGFQVNATGARFLLSTVHMRSKLCDGASGGNTDQGDGQSCFNAQRRTQAAELVAHWAQLRQLTGIAAQVMLGDFNAYTEEDPLDVLRAAGLQRLATGPYTYRFQQAFGALDHAFATPAFAAAVTGAASWAINSDEPEALDYAVENLSRYQPNAFRSSDHDPVLVGLSAAQLPVGVDESMLPDIQVFQQDGRLVMRRTQGSWPAGTRLVLYEASGRLALHRPVSGSEAHVPVDHLADGVYGWQLIAPGLAPLAGRTVVQRP
jgi:predicted extracellular nuclease